VLPANILTQVPWKRRLNLSSIARYTWIIIIGASLISSLVQHLVQPTHQDQKPPANAPSKAEKNTSKLEPARNTTPPAAAQSENQPEGKLAQTLQYGDLVVSVYEISATDGAEMNLTVMAMRSRI
jgi:hypothetical protein